MNLVLERPVRPQPKVVRTPQSAADSRVGFWHAPAVIAENHFVYKSLSNWAFNVAVGCSHACRFCYVPSAATIKQGPKLAEYGVNDPDAEWGDYVLLRPWDEPKFLASLRAAENTPRSKLKRDGNRAVIYCSTTDPYQVIRHPDPARQRELADHTRCLVRRSLELIRDQSTLNVRILTRSPLARADFDLFRSFGKRLVFGMSLPTLRNDLAKVYEPKAPAPSQRLATLRPRKRPAFTFMWPWRRLMPSATKPTCTRPSNLWPNWTPSPFSTNRSTSGLKTWPGSKNKSNHSVCD